MLPKVDLADNSKKKTSSGNLKEVNNPLVRKDGKTVTKKKVRGYAYDERTHQRQR